MRQPRKQQVRRGPVRQVARKVPRQPIDLSNLKDRAKGGFVGLFRGQSFEYRFLLAITFALFAIGVIMVLDASYVTQLSAGNNPFSTVLRQLGIGIGGIALMLFISRMSVERLIAIAPLYTISVLGLQGLTLLIGKAVGGNRNWIQIGTLPALQPSEFLKIGLIILVAKIAIERADDFGDLMHYWRWVAIYPGAGMVLVFLGGDMGTVMIMVAILLVQLMLIGLQRPYMRLLLLVVSLLALIGTFGSSNRRARTMAWLFPDSPDPMDLGWQSKHGVWALAAGGFGGVGFGNSTMKWSWIPEIDNDYIFAVIGEEFGLIGSAVVIGMFVALGIILIRIMNRSQDLWAKFVVGGVFAWLIFQALVNIAVVLSLLPVLGVTLPMISSGGSSLIANLMAIGVVLAIERRNSGTDAPMRRTQKRRPQKARR